jgi:hypothetical protein
VTTFTYSWNGEPIDQAARAEIFRVAASKDQRPTREWRATGPGTRMLDRARNETRNEALNETAPGSRP